MDGKVCIIAMTRDLLGKIGIEANDTEGIIDYAIAVKGVEIGVSICEEKANEFKVSFRSRGRNVDEVAAVFGGGGHMYASGCRIFGKKEDVIDKILKAIRDTRRIMGGVLNIYKPPGLSSAAVVGKVKHILGTRAVGHMGHARPDGRGCAADGRGKGHPPVRLVSRQVKDVRSNFPVRHNDGHHRLDGYGDR